MENAGGIKKLYGVTQTKTGINVYQGYEDIGMHKDMLIKKYKKYITVYPCMVIETSNEDFKRLLESLEQESILLAIHMAINNSVENTSVLYHYKVAKFK